MAHYELTFLTRSEDDRGGMNELISLLGGKVTAETALGFRKLATSVKKETSAAYFTYQIELPVDKLEEFNIKLKRNDHVLRYLLIAGGLRKGPEVAPRRPKPNETPTQETIEQITEPITKPALVEPTAPLEPTETKDSTDKEIKAALAEEEIRPVEKEKDEDRQKKLDEKLKQILDK